MTLIKHPVNSSLDIIPAKTVQPDSIQRLYRGNTIIWTPGYYYTMLCSGHTVNALFMERRFGCENIARTLNGDARAVCKSWQLDNDSPVGGLQFSKEFFKLPPPALNLAAAVCSLWRAMTWCAALNMFHIYRATSASGLPHSIPLTITQCLNQLCALRWNRMKQMWAWMLLKERFMLIIT